MKWDVEYTDEFGDWWGGLGEAEQESVRASIKLLEGANRGNGKNRTLRIFWGL